MKPFRQFNFFVLFTVALLFWGYCGTAAAASDPAADLDAFITRALKEYKVPGAAVAVDRSVEPYSAQPSGQMTKPE